MHSVLFSPFCPLKFYSVHSVLFSLLRSCQPIQSTLALVDPYWSYAVHFSHIQFTLVLFGPFCSLSFYLVLFNPFCSLWSTSVLFGPFGRLWSYLVHFVHFSFIWSILSYSVHDVPFWSTSVQYVYFSLIGSVHFVHCGLIRSYSVHISLILSTSVLSGQHCLIWSILSTLVLFGPIRTEWNAKWKNSQRMRNMVEYNALTCDDPRHFLL